ncbi:uncharacterized protein LOC125592023 [Brassica napus]|uniref:uncharacterized protein LOC106309241 n=1 Tax=Brassica oleracea var. oleracea TaxID=109376 RepID=UPI0006A6BB2D|nr:PREDICTED: uncharacterized protein LOC106309241 [Brassica oleracea var. oleracea]XP_048622958.1 uncharacterized protein LOC125592023 [Brassica napus]
MAPPVGNNYLNVYLLTRLNQTCYIATRIQFNKNLTDHSKVEEAYAEGKKQLEVVERVVKVYLAYPPKTKNIMELKLQ